jgi:hypothetical protein
MGNGSRGSALAAEVASRDEPSVAVRLLVGSVVFLSAVLLFQLELLIAKYILPWFGGTPAVFTTCMLVFQVLLLLGYLYGHLLERRLAGTTQAVVHIVLLCAALGAVFWQVWAWHVPLLPNARFRPSNSLFPVWHVVLALLVSAAPPFFVLSTTAPLLQAWWSRMSGGMPYRWYALSNAGSLVALLTYPTIIEPTSTLKTQAVGWSFAFGVFVSGGAVIGAIAARFPRDQVEVLETAPQWRQRIMWIVLSCFGSILFLSGTNQICQEVAVVPFLWVLPLSLYLLSFILCFGSERSPSRVVWSGVLAAATVLLTVVLYAPEISWPLQVCVYALVLFAGCMICHGELVRSKPATTHLTSFYLWMALGGALGGVFVILVFPFIFKGFWEFYLSVWATWGLLCLFLLRDRASWIYYPKPILLSFCALMFLSGPVAISLTSRADLVAAGIGTVGLIAFLLSGGAKACEETQAKAAYFSVGFTLLLMGPTLLLPAFLYVRSAVAVYRNFFGVVSVTRDTVQSHGVLMLKHGTTIHGLEYTEPSRRSIPLGYYAPGSGIGLLLRDRIARNPTSPVRIGVVGLGVGSLAAYARKGDYVRFYEINPAVVDLSYSGPNKEFGFTSECRGKVDVVLGDARVSMERELGRNEPGRFDVLAIDAFSGDSIPVHLLTQEAFELYEREVNPTTGVVAFHISNRSLDLRPVVSSLAQQFKKKAWVVDYTDPESGGRSLWVLIGEIDSPLGSSMVPLHADPKFRLWTDNYSSLFSVLR